MALLLFIGIDGVVGVSDGIVICAVGVVGFVGFIRVDGLVGC